MAVVLGLLFVYDFVAGLAKVRADTAYAHGHDLLDLTPHHLELTANHWLAGVPWLQDPAAYYYDLAHIDVTLGVFLLCYFLKPAGYRLARNALVLINLAALVVFWAYPVAPPRLLPGAGFTDVVADSGTWGAWEAGGAVADRANEFGSMPSLHLAWATWVALVVWRMTDRRALRALGLLHVAITSVVVIYTGNHYAIDLLAGAALALIAWLAAQHWRSALTSLGWAHPRFTGTGASSRDGADSKAEGPLHV
ncbi:MAG: hypothetical protein JWM40_1417 [Frankiales bacterium]|nr:hypothetical protein [Frankiales bacterium]